MTDPSTGPDSDRWSAGSAWSADPAPTSTPSDPEPATRGATEPWATQPPTVPAYPTSPAVPAFPTATAPADPSPPAYPVPGPAHPVSAPGYAVSAPAGYPVSAPGYPVSAPAGYPVSAPGYPVSAPAGYPVSAPAGYPVSAPGYPVPGMPPVAAARPRRTAVLVLSILMVVFLLAAGALGGLYVTKANAYRQQAKTVAARDTTVKNQSNQINFLEQQLKSTQDKLTDATQKATGVQNQVDELTHEKQVISKCLDLLGQASDAAAKGDRTNANKLIAQSGPVCDEADNYLN